MKFLISYFYMIRFFKKNMIPFSTALWDPKWYHDFKGQDYMYIDGNGVLNGARCEELHFPENLYEELHEEQCVGRPCKYKPESCKFLKNYREYLFSLDFNKLVSSLESCANYSKEFIGTNDEPIIVLIVHEAPDNPCSERGPLIELFKNHGIDLQEFKEN